MKRLLNVFPLPTSTYPPNMLSRHPILFSQMARLFAISSPLTDLYNLIVGDNTGVYVPTLRPHISHIVKLSAQKQMAWINAYGIVTFVTDKKSFWNRAYENLVRNSMSHFPCFTYPKEPIAARVVCRPSCGPRPLPASVVYLNTSKEPDSVSFTVHTINHSHYQTRCQ